MSCNCLEEITNKLKEKTGDSDLKILSIINFKTGKLKPYIEVEYRKKKINGDLKLKVEKSFISPDFCPFCGEEYETN